MSAEETGLTKLTGFDRTVLCLLGLIVILGLGAVLNAPFLWIIIAGAAYVITVQIYGRLSRDRDSPDPALAKNRANEGIFDQRAIADSLSEAVWIVNEREQIIYANAKSSTLFGPTPFGRPLATIVREPAVTRLVKAVFSDSTADPVDYHRSAPVDQHFRVTATLITIDREEDKLRSFVMIVFYDISDLVKFALTQGDFLANASHELKTPIASLLGYIETLRGHAKDDPTARERFLAIMQEQAERMQRLISDLLSLRQIEQSEHIAPSSAADIRAAVNFACDTVTPIAQARGVSVTIDGPDALLVKGQQDELVQLCLNIIDNAVKMSPEGAFVSVQLSKIGNWRAQDFIGTDKQSRASNRQIITPASAPDGYAVIRFGDNGPGFAAQHIPRLGERFYRITGDRNSKEKGTGLGLAIVKHIVLRHRGGLHVSSISAQSVESLEGISPAEPPSSTLETGTVFTVLIPLAKI